MKRSACISLLSVLLLGAAPQAVAERMCIDTTSSAATGTLTDSGGSANNGNARYQNNERCGFTIQANSGDSITLTFTDFNYEFGYDFLRLYDGTSASAPLIGSYTGTTLPGTLVATSGNLYVLNTTDFSVRRPGFLATWSVTTGSGGGSCPAESVADNFPSISYGQNAGSQVWSGDWQEIGEADGPSAGIARVNSSNCTSGQCLRIGEPSGQATFTGRGASREVDLDGALSATLSFVYRTGHSRGNQTVYLEVSPDGGATWVQLASYRTNPTSFTGVTENFDITAYASANTQIRFISEGSNSRAGLYVDDIEISYQPNCFAPISEWRFDEASWSGSLADVEDQNATLDGIARGGASTISDGQVCRAGTFDGANDFIQAPSNLAQLADTASLSFWIRTTQVGNNTAWRAPGIAGVEQAGGTDDIFWGYIRQDGRIGIGAGNDFSNYSTTPINDGAWHHVVLTRDANTGQQNTYVDGVLEDSATQATGVIGVPFSSLGRIEDSGGSPAYIEGDIDEILIFDTVLSATEVADIYTNQAAGNGWDGAVRSCPLAGTTYFTLNHDTSGIHCTAESIAVTARRSDGSIDTAFSQQVSLDTQTGRGTWTLLAGSGAFSDSTADDGIASYTFVPADGGSATFALSYPEGVPTMDVDSYLISDSTIRDDDSEGMLTFAASGITVTRSALPNPPPNPINDPIGTQRAGRPFALHLTAYGTTPTDPQCGVIETYQGDRNLRFWFTRQDPTLGTIVPTIAGTPLTTSPASAVAQSVTFTAGQAVVNANYKDAGAISFALQDDSSYGHVLAGGTPSFVVQPDYLEVSAVTDSALLPNPEAADMSDAGFVPAGEAFRVIVTARDADGDATPNFGLESAAEGVAVSATLLEPSGGRTGSTGDVLNGVAFVRTGAGELTATTVIFDEVGIISLTPRIADSDYLGSGAVTGLVSPNVGRFYPATFALSGDSVTGACNNVTYADQDAISVLALLEARNTLSARVENYDASLISPTLLAAPNWVAENDDDGVDRSGRLNVAASSWIGGRYQIADNNAFFSRTGVPDGPFDMLRIGLSANEPLDGVSIAGHDMEADSAGNCIATGTCDAKQVGSATSIRYGRALLGAGQAPEFSPLDLPFSTEYWDGLGFRHHSGDDCTGYRASLVSLSNFTGNLSVGETTPSSPTLDQTLDEGIPDAANPFLLSAPGIGNDGSVIALVDVPPWLEFDWLGSGDVDPRERQTFGHYRGHDAVIYWEEFTR